MHSLPNLCPFGGGGYHGRKLHVLPILSPHSQDAVVLSTMFRDLLLASGVSCSQFSVILGTKLFSDESSHLDVEENMHHPVGTWED